MSRLVEPKGGDDTKDRLVETRKKGEKMKFTAADLILVACAVFFLELAIVALFLGWY